MESDFYFIFFLSSYKYIILIFDEERKFLFLFRSLPLFLFPLRPEKIIRETAVYRFTFFMKPAFAGGFI